MNKNESKILLVQERENEMVASHACHVAQASPRKETNLKEFKSPPSGHLTLVSPASHDHHHHHTTRTTAANTAVVKDHLTDTFGHILTALQHATINTATYSN